ncbi:uncharacterized protein LOC116842608 [Odontomachus brunneus]|uniref:uncharacterized protein LOC116842608 n=1 Tax=Odontomachus brunneus TaxID=486640 RepID=UPI0013F19F5D|nr:uncharacterized protein LOC116842608 [Odontomachus brunneus]
MSITNMLKFRKTCCKAYFRVCPCSFVRHRVQLKTPREECYNFVFISAKYIAELYHWTQKYVFKRLLADDFLWSVVTSTFLFAIGIKLSAELDAWDLPKIIR